jgi:hypothetical protein
VEAAVVLAGNLVEEVDVGIRADADEEVRRGMNQEGEEDARDDERLVVLGAYRNADRRRFVCL